MNGRNSVLQGAVAVVGVLVVVAGIGVVLGTAGVVATGPGEPISFYGEATDTDGNPAPAGTVIVATVDGTEVDRITVDESGIYASDSPTAEKLRTQTGAGDTVTFHVGTVDGPQASETYEIDESGVFELDLTFPAGTFEEDDSQSGGGGVGGDSGGTTGDNEGSTGSEGSPGETAGENRVTVELALGDETTSDGDGGDDVVSGSITVAADANSSIDVTLVSDDETAGGVTSNQTAANPVATVERIEIDVAENVEMSLEVQQGSGPSGEDAQEFEPADGTQPVGYLQIDTNVSNEQISSARIGFRMSRAALNEAGMTVEDVAMYHFNEENGEWEELPTAVVEETDTFIRFRAETGGFSQFAVGIKRPQFELADTSIDGRPYTVGESVAVKVWIANSGGADGTFDATLRVGDDVIDQSELSVAAGETEATVFKFVFDQPGTYQLWVNDFAITEIDVTSPADEDQEDELSVDDDQQPSDDEDSETTQASTGSGGLQGVGLVAALLTILIVLAFLVVVRLVWRT